MRRPPRNDFRVVAQVVCQLQTNSVIDDGMDLAIADFREASHPGSCWWGVRKQRQMWDYLFEIFDDRRGLGEHQIAVNECRHKALWIDVEIGPFEMLLAVGVHVYRLERHGLQIERDAGAIKCR